jgi:hypothetical protein
MKKLFDINEEEKNRILEMHVSATKRHYLNEQTPQPKAPGVVNQPSGKIGFTEVAGEASNIPVKDASVLTNIGVPATPENFNNTFFYTDRSGLAKASMDKNLGTFTMTNPRTTKSPDNVFAVYNDGSEVRLEGSGTKEFLTKGLKYIGGAGNGLLALQRALYSGTGYLPGKIKITLAGGMKGSSYSYNSTNVNNTQSLFNNLVAHFIKPLVDPSKVSSSYINRDIVLGLPNAQTITNTINALFGKFLPKKEGQRTMDVAKEYGLDMTPEVFEQQITSTSSSDLPNLDNKWNKIQSDIIAKYKENLDKFLTQKFPENKDAYLSKFNPIGPQDSPSQELKDISNTTLPGYSVPQQKPAEKQQNKQFKIGQGK